MKYSLFHKQSCPYCQRVRVVMEDLGLTDTIPLIDVYAQPEQYDLLIKEGGKRMIPCLRIEQEDGTSQWMYESSDIIAYLKQNFSA